MHTNTYPTIPEINITPLPDLFHPPGRTTPITTANEWPKAAQEWLDILIPTEYGTMPPAPSELRFERIHDNTRRAWPRTPQYLGYKVHCSGGTHPFNFTVKIVIPQSKKPVPIVINGDACWPRKEENIIAVLEAGYALAIFDRTEAARDVQERECRESREGGLYDVYPEINFSALNAWAWCYHRVVDLIETIPTLDASRIAISGHSRGGKTCLLAGATDPRITLINDNASCAGGGALFRYVGNKGEKIDIVTYFPDWFNPEMQQYVGNEGALPFDQHCLLASLAPRPTLLTYALDDRWSNPEGIVKCAEAAQPAFDLLNASDRLNFHLRSGDHAHNLEDWNVLIDFMNWQWKGSEPSAPFNQHPYTHLRTI